MEPNQAPFLQLMVNAYDPKSLILGAIPVIVLLIFGIVVALLRARRQKEERKL